MWSGSEELWTRSAVAFKIKGCKIYSATKYNNSQVALLNEHNLNYSKQFQNSKGKKLFQKLRFKKTVIRNLLFEFINEVKPDCVIISQGNNVESFAEMQYCIEKNIPFITITQLVTDVHFLYINNENLKPYQSVYLKAVKNFFVSKRNLLLNNLMFGVDFPNSEVIYNPCRVFGDSLISYPDTDTYNIALVGRIECLHKGYDLILEVISEDKWRARNVCFNFYGTGPHTKLLQDNCNKLKLKNISFKGFEENVSDIWKFNHLLCMPSRMEGQSLALIEAMYYARCIVATNVGGVEELVQNNINGFIANATTVESLNIALENAWTKRFDWEQMGAVSHEIIVKYYKQPAEEYLNRKIESYMAFDYD